VPPPIRDRGIITALFCYINLYCHTVFDPIDIIQHSTKPSLIYLSVTTLPWPLRYFSFLSISNVHRSVLTSVLINFTARSFFVGSLPCVRQLLTQLLILSCNLNEKLFPVSMVRLLGTFPARLYLLPSLPSCILLHLHPPWHLGNKTKDTLPTNVKKVQI